jgi:hypothetical protein
MKRPTGRSSRKPSSQPKQLAEFQEAARAAECDEDASHFAERLKKVASQKKEGGGPAKGRQEK